MNFEEKLEQGIFFGFIPRHLEIDERPELNIFSLNVLFMRYKVENGKNIRASVTYEPDLKSYKQKGQKCSMKYNNIYGGDGCLVIEYDMLEKSYCGKKIVNKELVGMATGTEWHMFFIHFTLLGLFNGERCKFELVN